MNNKINEKEIKKELAMRELARRKLEYFVKYTKDDYEMTAYQWDIENKIHTKIIEKLEAVERWEIKRLMIFVRPRMWKSELVSKRFPARCLWRNSKRNIILASYWYELAVDFWRKTKQIVESQEYKNLFPDFKLSKDKKESWNWETIDLWGYYSIWVWGALTWKWGDILIIDDPVKNREDAESPVFQQKTIDRYTSTFYTRKQSQDSAIILMMTRWNKNDLAWYLINEQNNWWDKREILSIPAIDEWGNAIIRPGKWDKWYIEAEKKNISAKDWAALYQQDPIAAWNNIFDMTKLRYYNMSDFEKADWILKKEDLKCWIYVDPAFSTSKTSDDAVVLAVWKHKISWNYYLIDWYAETSAPSKTFQAIITMYDRLSLEWFKFDYISIEDVKINKEQTKFIEDFKSFLKANNRYIIVNSYFPEWKKQDRIKFILEPKISVSALYFRKDLIDNSFIRRLETQLSDFPNNKHDDIIDCLTQSVQVLDQRFELSNKKTERTFYNKLTWQIQQWNRVIKNLWLQNNQTFNY